MSQHGLVERSKRIHAAKAATMATLLDAVKIVFQLPDQSTVRFYMDDGSKDTFNIATTNT